MRKFILSPSMLAADFGHLEEQIHAAERAGCEYLHIDVMDGKYVPSISFGMPVIANIRKYTKMVFDVHLMVEDPGRFVEDFKKAGADILTVHAEACVHLDRTLQQIREAGMKVGVTLNPATPLSAVELVLDKVDMVLLMSVNPGFGGQSYIPYVTQKIRDLRTMLDVRGLEHVDIEVDGGVKLNNLEEVLQAGANVIVAGSAVFGEKTEENARAFLQVMKHYEG